MSSFRITLDFDAVTITRKESLVGGICFCINEQPFPDGEWSDFLIVLAHWVAEAKTMTNPKTNSVRFGFMEGPYEVVVARSGEFEWDVFGRSRSENCDMVNVKSLPTEEILHEVHRAASSIVDYCRSKDIRSPDLEKIERAVNVNM